jgi:transposase
LSNERSNITELAREGGYSVSLLYKWLKDYDKFGLEFFSWQGTFKQTQNKKA